MLFMNVQEFIEVLKQFPPESEIMFTDQYEEDCDTHLFAIHHAKEYPEYGNIPLYDSTRILLMREPPEYDDLLCEKFEAPWYIDEQVWYNKDEPLRTWNNDHQVVEFYYDEDKHMFLEKKEK